ncbi:MAG: hypothetical protein KF893_02780 [Caldilineaceae bacterium]|nr:hypothetical protein [Caldilineaceae bacterium]
MPTPTKIYSFPSRLVAALLIVFIFLSTAIGLILLVERQSLIGDSIGYLYAAQSIASGIGPVYNDPNNSLAGPYFSLYAFQIRHPDSDLAYLGFPPGLPLLLSIPLLFNVESSLVLWVVPFTVLLCIIFCGILAWALTKSIWSVFWATLLLSVTPDLWYFGTAIWSEFPSTAVMSAALAFYLLTQIYPVRRRTETALMGLIGILLVFNVFIRYTNLVVLLVFLAVDTLRLLKDRSKLSSHWPLWGLSALVIVAVPLFNYFYYGGWNITSYSPAHGWYPWPAFSLDYALGPSFVDGYSLLAGITTLWQNFGIFLPLAVMGWILLGRTGGFFAGISLAIFGIHAIYAFAPTGINARFLIPLFPLLAIGAAMAIVTMLRRIPQLPKVAIAFLLVALAIWQIPDTLESPANRNQTNTQHIALIQSITARTESNAVFMSYAWNDLIAIYGDRSVFNYRRVPVSDPVQGRYHIVEAIPVIMDVITALLKQHIPVYFVAGHNNFINDLPETLTSHFSVELININDVTLYKLALPANP